MDANAIIKTSISFLELFSGPKGPYTTSLDASRKVEYRVRNWVENLDTIWGRCDRLDYHVNMKLNWDKF